MKILNLRQFNEKLNIKPITKERIGMGFAKPCHTVKEMRESIQTGDIAIIDTVYVIDGKEHSWKHDRRFETYISYKDIDDETYNEMLDMSFLTLRSDEMKEGMFISFWSSSSSFAHSDMSKFDDDFIAATTTDTMKFKIMEIRRVPKLELPLTLDYFKKPPIEKSVIVWKRK